MTPESEMIKNCDFDDTKPTLLSLPICDSLPYRSASDILSSFGDVVVNLTDNKGFFVRSSQFRDLTKWWENISETSSEDALNGNVAHYTIHKDNRSAPLKRVIDAVTRKLTTLSLDRKCIFDIYDFDQIPRFEWIIIGPNALPVKIHQDMFGTASWNLLFSGKKEWLFWEPELSVVEGSLPAFRFEQNPGEVVWIPENWWHSVNYNAPSICFSKNLVLRRSVNKVLASMSTRAPKYSHILKTILFLEQKGQAHVS